VLQVSIREQEGRSGSPAPISPMQDEYNPDEMKKKIKAIHSDENLSANDKARLVQNLMTGRWQKAMEAKGLNSPRMSSPRSGSGCNSPIPGPENDLDEEERAPSYHVVKNSNEKVFGCQHYRRNCKVRAKCCGKVFPCRFCHDEATEDHTMDRYATDEMYCLFCKTLQPIGARCNSKKCGGRPMAKYYCNVCKFYDDDPEKDIYHCPHCNICRIGKGLGIDYFHCMKCNACMSTSLQNHRCVERSLESDCPICHHFMFTSTTPVMFMSCGHCMHVSCFEQYTMTNYTCPICSKSLGDMSAYFSRLDAHLAAEQMPEEYANMTSDIFCCDCEAKSTVKFHFMYHKCAQCGSYNTKVLGHQRNCTNGPARS